MVLLSNKELGEGQVIQIEEVTGVRDNALFQEHSKVTTFGHGSPLPSVSDFLRGKDVLVTGASGFLGRTLLEKLLREAPDVGTIFLLLRSKRGCAPHDRLQPLTNVKLFQRLRVQHPHALDKLHVVAGDVIEPGLGLSAEDAAMMRKCVHIVFHVAASVRFDDPLKKSLLLNVRGTRELCELAKGMNKLQVFLHVSTAYTNLEHPVNEEKWLSPPGDWRLFVEMAETMDRFPLDVLTKSVLGVYPNTYTLTKTLAENVIHDYKYEVPMAIIRPSIVLGTKEDPFPGWLDNTYGPLGLSLAAQAGGLHSIICIPGAELDVIPVDTVVRGMILLAMRRYFMREKGLLPVVNATAYNFCCFNPLQASKLLRILHFDFPLPILYKPFIIPVPYKFLFYILFYIIDLPISMIYGLLFRIMGRKESILKLHRTIFISYKKLFFFALQKFRIPHTKFINLCYGIHPDDKIKFKIAIDDICLVPYHLSVALQLKRYFIKEEQKATVRQYVLMEFLHYVVCGTCLYIVWTMNLPLHIFNFGVTFARLILVF